MRVPPRGKSADFGEDGKLLAVGGMNPAWSLPRGGQQAGLCLSGVLKAARVLEVQATLRVRWALPQACVLLGTDAKAWGGGCHRVWGGLCTAEGGLSCLLG